MIIISHRANIDDDTQNTLENSPHQIMRCLNEGFDVEIDVWRIDNQMFLGHDSPQYKIDYNFLENKKLWCHAKNHEALMVMTHNHKINCFWHDTDKYTLTSRGFVWVYPNVELPKNSVAVMPEKTNYSIDDLKKCYAVCTDRPYYYKTLLGV